MKSQVINQKSLLINETRNVSLKTSKQVFVNNDGTIAENFNTYKEYKNEKK